MDIGSDEVKLETRQPCWQCGSSGDERRVFCKYPEDKGEGLVVVLDYKTRHQEKFNRCQFHLWRGALFRYMYVPKSFL